MTGLRLPNEDHRGQTGYAFYVYSEDRRIDKPDRATCAKWEIDPQSPLSHVWYT
jgi:hypothetical protein